MATISGGFRGFQINGGAGKVNVQDQDVGGSSSAWTTGAKLVDTVQIQAALGKPWTIVGYTIALNLWMTTPIVTSAFGRLGVLFGGLVASASATPAVSTGLASVSPAAPLPSDMSMITQLWDGTQDPAPPVLASLSAAPPQPPTTIVGGLQLPSPLPIATGDQLCIGLWLMPSLIKNVILYVMDAQWTISYSEPDQPQGIWS